MNNWKIVCDKVSTTMDLSEMEFEKGVATLILSFLGWNEFRGNIKEQYHIEDHAKGYKPDFALFADSNGEPSIFVELKETGHKQRSKDVKQIRTYMMLTNCRFCIYFGEKMELFFIKIDGTHRSLKSVLTLDYNPKHPDGNRLLDLITCDTFDEDRLVRFCEDRLAADEAANFFTSEEGRKRLYELMAKDRQLSEGAALLLPSMLTSPERKEQGVETIGDEETMEDKDEAESQANPKPQKKEPKSNIREHKVWMISASSKFFDHKACFKEFGQIYWKQHKNFKVGDTGYIYFSKPRQEVVFKFEVTACDLPYSDEMAVDKKFYKRESDFIQLKEHNRIFIAKLLEESVSGKLTLSNMQKNGLKAAPLGPLNLSDKSFEKLLAYIESNF